MWFEVVISTSKLEEEKMDISDTDKAELEALITKWLERGQILPRHETLVVDLKVVKQSWVKINVGQTNADPRTLAGLAKCPISYLNISRPLVEKTLNDREIRTIGKVLEQGYLGLIKTRHLGLKSFREIRNKLGDMGFNLGKEWVISCNDKWVPDLSTTVIE